MRKTIAIIILLLGTHFAQAQNYKIEGNELKITDAVQFQSEKFQLSASDINSLKTVRDFLNEKTYVSLMRIESHVDGTKNNQQISGQRAVAIAEWLIKEGIDCKRLIVVGFGNTKPAEKTTRINFILAGLRGKMIGGMPEDGGGKVAADACRITK